MSDLSGVLGLDTHCHLGQYPDIDAVVSRAEGAGIVTWVSTAKASEFRGLRTLLAGRSWTVPGIGMHPEIAGSVYEEYEWEIFAAEVGAVTLVSEVGLDGAIADAVGPAFGATPSLVHQTRLFDMVLAAVGPKHVMSVHSRGAEGQVLEMLSGSSAGNAVLHNFTGDVGATASAIGAGHHFSVNPWMFQSDAGLDVICAVPEELLLIETDGPFSRRDGWSYEPSDHDLIVSHLIEARGAGERLRGQVAANARHLLADIC